jgi:L-lactate dehydrogenase complex protein LldG
LLLAPFSPWIRLSAVTGWGYSKDFPRFVGKTFRERYVEKQADATKSRLANTDIEKPIDTSVGMQVEDLTLQFARELTSLGGHVRETSNVTQDVIEFLKSREITKIHLEPDTLDESQLRKAGIAFTHEPDPQILAGVTKAICGLADTGSVLEADGEGSPLHASLLPQIHLAILNQADILPSLPNAMHLVEDKRSAVFITGPSRTADIEMTLTIGVHGPGEVIVFLTE